jgi:hypothetical protein
MQVELVQHLLGSNRRPAGQRGWFAWARVGSNVTTTQAFKLLQNQWPTDAMKGRGLPVWAVVGSAAAAAAHGHAADLTADHITPVAAGGAEDGPLSVLCRVSNGAKQNRLR